MTGIPLDEAVRRLAAAAHAAGLDIDERNVFLQPSPYPSYEYALRLRQAHGLFCMPVHLVESADHAAALRAPMERAKKYLEPFVGIQERAELAARGIPRFQQWHRP
jgi:hypothetical protein